MYSLEKEKSGTPILFYHLHLDSHMRALHEYCSASLMGLEDMIRISPAGPRQRIGSLVCGIPEMSTRNVEPFVLAPALFD